MKKIWAVSCKNVTVAYHNEAVLWNVNATLLSGGMIGIIGPNGAGKTTLIKTIVGLVQPLAGTVTINTAVSKGMPCAYVAQRTSVDWDFPIRVRDVVMMGRYVHMSFFSRPSRDDVQAVADAIDIVGLTPYADRSIAELSGGQQQRVFLARALAQDAFIIVLDEPFNGVDVQTEQIIVSVLKKQRDAGKTIIVVHHNMHTCKNYFDELLYIDRVVKAQGTVDSVLPLFV